jgi:fructose-bisphosphate aldolase/2-amino-3,7-dideoxy-D-threo-hept-6-ulosonate synthase
MVFGKQVRLARITKHGRMLCIPMDHSFTVGPIAGLESPEEMIVKIAKGGATAFLVHKGVIKSLRKPVPIGMIMHVSASTSLSLAPNRKMLNSSVLEGIRLGADAISVHVNMGSKEEPEMLEQLGMVADQCDEYQVPFIARVGAESGADVVKTVYTGDPESFKEVVRKCPVPVVLAGGAKVDTDEAILNLAHDVMDAGAMGVTFGRNVFQHRDPTLIVKALRRIVIDRSSVEEAMEVMSAANA